MAPHAALSANLERDGLQQHDEQHDEQPPANDPDRQYNNLLLDAIFVVDAAANVVNVSGACERIFGYSGTEMVGKNMLDLVLPQDRERTLQSIERVMGGYLQSYFENRYVRKDGDIVLISWSASWSEEHQVRVGVARDITSRATDNGALVAGQLLPAPLARWHLASSPRTLLTPDGVLIALSVQDHVVLLVLMSADGVTTRRSIVEALGEDYIDYDQRRLDTQIRRLRRKVLQAGTHPLPISTLRSVGFQFYEKATIER